MGSFALPEQRQNQHSQAFRVEGFGILEFICSNFLFTVGAPMPTSAECGYPAVGWSPSNHGTCHPKNHCRSLYGVPAAVVGKVSVSRAEIVCPELLLLALSWVFCSSVHILEILTWHLAFFISYPGSNSSRSHPPTPIPILQMGTLKL